MKCNLLAITAVSLEELPDDIQHTKERKPDVLKTVTDNQGNTFVIQIEFQVANDDEMVHRMLDYRGMLIRKYKLPTYQYVIFLGKGKPKMATELQNIDLAFKYNLLAINSRCMILGITAASAVRFDVFFENFAVRRRGRIDLIAFSFCKISKMPRDNIEGRQEENIFKRFTSATLEIEIYIN
jgi:hypothetical protein